MKMSGEGLLDIHCHIIPEVDDGASDSKEMKKMLQMEYTQGVRNLIVTPHFRYGMFETPLKQIKQQFQSVEQAAKQIGTDFRVYLGCELHSNMEITQLLHDGIVSTMADSRYVLIEFSENSRDSYVRERLYKLLSNGYKPIVAHIERYECTRKSLDFVEELVDMGALMQINADSILGKNGLGAKNYCRKLMKYDLLHFAGSDCHGSTSRITRIGEAFCYVTKKMGNDYANEIFVNNPRKILEDGKRRKEK